VTGPGDLRARFARHTAAQLVTGLAALRPRPGEVPGYATRIALRELARRAQFLDSRIGHLDELIVSLVAARTPSLERLLLRRPLLQQSQSQGVAYRLAHAVEHGRGPRESSPAVVRITHIDIPGHPWEQVHMQCGTVFP